MVYVSVFNWEQWVLYLKPDFPVSHYSSGSRPAIGLLPGLCGSPDSSSIQGICYQPDVPLMHDIEI